MILAGDVGGTKTILGLFKKAGGKLQRVREETFRSSTYPSLDAIVTVADATDIIERIEDPLYGPLARRQLVAADVEVMTKTDLLDAAPPDLGVVTGAPVTTHDVDVALVDEVGHPEMLRLQSGCSGDLIRARHRRGSHPSMPSETPGNF